MKTLDLEPSTQTIGAGGIIGENEFLHAMGISRGEIRIKTSPKQHTIVLQPYVPSKEPLPIQEIDKSLSKLDFDIKKEEVTEYFQNLKNFLRDPEKVSEGLKDLDRELGARLAWDTKPPQNPPVDTLLQINAALYIPSMPRNYLPLSKKKMLSTILLEREQATGINTKDGVFHFYDFVEPKKAKEFTLDGNLFRDATGMGRLSDHGKDSHRLQWECMRSWDRDGSLPLPKKHHASKVTYPELARLFMLHDALSKQDHSPNIWLRSIDNIADQKNIQRGGEYRFSFVSPFMVQSGLSCFGDALGLPHLGRYMADGRFKELAQKSNRFIKQTKNLLMISKALGISEQEIRLNPTPLSDFISFAENAFERYQQLPGEVGLYGPWGLYPASSQPLTNTNAFGDKTARIVAEERRNRDKFQPEDGFIVKKITPHSALSERAYTSWNHYLNWKNTEQVVRNFQNPQKSDAERAMPVMLCARVAEKEQIDDVLHSVETIGASEWRMGIFCAILVSPKKTPEHIRKIRQSMHGMNPEMRDLTLSICDRAENDPASKLNVEQIKQLRFWLPKDFGTGQLLSHVFENPPPLAPQGPPTQRVSSIQSADPRSPSQGERLQKRKAETDPSEERKTPPSRGGFGSRG